MSQNVHKNSTSFLIYALYAILLWCIYNGFNQIYLNIFDDIVLGNPVSRSFFNFDYGQAATLVLLAVFGFFIVRYFAQKILKKNPAFLEAGSRLWMLRLILLIASLFAFIDLYILLSALITGDGLNIELFKTLITLAVTAGIVLFCYFELRCDSMATIPFMSFASVSFLCLSTITFVSALYMAPPWEMVKVRKDVERIHAMTRVTTLLNDYYAKHDALPQHLKELEKFVRAEELNDPVEKKPFDYRVVDSNHYELCATFLTDKAQAARVGRYYGNLEKFDYKKGNSCYQGQVFKPLSDKTSHY